MEFKHISVLYEETLKNLNINDGGVYADGTLGGGGHTSGILTRGDKIKVIGIDQDAEAIAAASERLQKFGDRFIPVKDNFKNIRPILERLNIDALDGAVLDLGVSSYQLDNGERGFSYMHDAPLDMRMNRDDAKSAYEVVNEYDEDRLADIFFRYGEEKWSRRIAKRIAERRAERPIKTTFELVDIIKEAIPKKAQAEGGHPAKRVFQAVRIEVNGELALLENAVRDFISVLKPGGRLCVITFHSLEDRIIKHTFAELAKGCVCPKEFPVCVCGHKPEVQVITRKPILPSMREQEENPRSKSAKLRAAQKL